MANQECVEPLLKKVKTGKKIHCHDQLIPKQSWCGTLFNGYWRDNDQEKEVVVRRIKKTACRDNWINIFDSQKTNSLAHKNVLNVIGYNDFDEKDPWRYFALELFDATLEHYCSREYNGPMPAKAITLFQIAEGLNYLHGIGLAHGNLSPSSIMIVQKSESVVIKISDFLYGGSKEEEEENVDCVLHSKYWMLPKICLTARNVQDVSKVTSPLTVHGDVFAAGCVFFYFLFRGLHPFGNVKDIPDNIAKYQPVNLKKLDINHFAYQSIKDMIGEPPQNGTQYLRIAATHFKDVPPYNFKEIRRPFVFLHEIILVRFHPWRPVLACCNRNEITVFSASKDSIPFSLWKESEMKFKGHLRLGLPKAAIQITSLQWNSDGNLLAAGHEDGFVTVWEYPSGEIVFKVRHHFEEVIGIYWGPFPSGYLVTRDRVKNQLCLWNAYPRNHQKTLSGTYECGKIIVSVLWTNLQIIVGCRDGTINILDIIEETGLLLFLTLKENVSPYGEGGFLAPKDPIRSLFWDEDTKCLASVNQNHSMNIWSLDSYQVIHLSKIDSTWQCLTRRPNKETSDQINVANKLMTNFHFACGLENGSIVMWNPFEEKKILPLKKIHHHSSPIIRLSFSPDGTFLASACKDEIVIWSTESWIPVFKGESNDNKGFSWLNVNSYKEPVYKLALSSANSNVIRVIEIADTEIDMWEENKN